MRKFIGKVSIFVRTCVYLLLTSQIKARLSRDANSACTKDPQQVFKRTFNTLIKITLLSMILTEIRVP